MHKGTTEGCRGWFGGWAHLDFNAGSILQNHWTAAFLLATCWVGQLCSKLLEEALPVYCGRAWLACTEPQAHPTPLELQHHLQVITQLQRRTSLMVLWLNWKKLFRQVQKLLECHPRRVEAGGMIIFRHNVWPCVWDFGTFRSIVIAHSMSCHSFLRKGAHWDLWLDQLTVRFFFLTS